MGEEFLIEFDLVFYIISFALNSGFRYYSQYDLRWIKLSFLFKLFVMNCLCLFLSFSQIAHTTTQSWLSHYFTWSIVYFTFFKYVGTNKFQKFFKIGSFTQKILFSDQAIELFMDTIKNFPYNKNQVKNH